MTDIIAQTLAVFTALDATATLDTAICDINYGEDHSDMTGMMNIESEFGVDIEVADWEQLGTVKDVAAFVQELQAGQVIPSRASGTTFYAQPYNIGVTGFYFTDADDYHAKAKRHRCEEFELQFVDGDDIDAKLFEAAKINQATIDQWAEIEDHEHKEALLWLLDDRGCTLEEAQEKAEDVILFEGSLTNYAWDFAKDCLNIDAWPDAAQRYWDAEAFGRDLDLGGDVDVVRIDGTDYVITNASQF